MRKRLAYTMRKPSTPATRHENMLSMRCVVSNTVWLAWDSISNRMDWLSMELNA